MKVSNYRDVRNLTAPRWRRRQHYRVTVHKSSPPADPRVSIVLLDWGCRERFTTLDFLARQDVPRELYELIWIELYDRVVPEVLDKADVVITLNQAGMYHKHIGYNVAHLHAKGEILTVCDSDAVFPRNFVTSVLRSFKMLDDAPPIPQVLMHHQWRTSHLYPESLDDPDTLRDPKWEWWPLIPNAGACMSVRREDVTRFGGFDEHESFRGYLCGPYDLGWRMVNAGWPEAWHDECVALWHFAHPDPVGTNGLQPVWQRLRENLYPHVDLHAITAVDAFSSGRILPLQENDGIWNLRMRARQIGSTFEKKYARMTSAQGFSVPQLRRMRMRLFGDMVGSKVGHAVSSVAESYLPGIAIDAVRACTNFVRDKFGVMPEGKRQPRLIGTVFGYNVVSFGNKYYGVPQSIGEINFLDSSNLRRPELIVRLSRRRVERAVRRIVKRSLQLAT